jgi:hypothetical protein
MIGEYSVAKNLLADYSEMSHAYTAYAVLGSGSLPAQNQSSVGQGISQPSRTDTAASRPQRAGPEAHDSRIEHGIREHGGTPRVDNTDRIHEQQERQRERPGDPEGSHRTYYG